MDGILSKLDVVALARIGIAGIAILYIILSARILGAAINKTNDLPARQAKLCALIVFTTLVLIAAVIYSQAVHERTVHANRLQIIGELQGISSNLEATSGGQLRNIITYTEHPPVWNKASNDINQNATVVLTVVTKACLQLDNVVKSISDTNHIANPFSN